MISRYLTLSGISVNQMTLFTEIQTLIIYLAENVGCFGLPSVAGKGPGSLNFKLLTLRRPGRQAWRPALFYGAPGSHLQVISKRRKMTPLEI